jgi:hypothetical protein
MTPVATTPLDLSPLTAVIERQAAEIARLSGALATAEERLRALGAGDAPDAPRLHPQEPITPPAWRRAPEPEEAPRRPWWRRLLGGR